MLYAIIGLFALAAVVGLIILKNWLTGQFLYVIKRHKRKDESHLAGYSTCIGRSSGFCLNCFNGDLIV